MLNGHYDEFPRATPKLVRLTQLGFDYHNDPATMRGLRASLVGRVTGYRNQSERDRLIVNFPTVEYVSPGFIGNRDGWPGVTLDLSPDEYEWFPVTYRKGQTVELQRGGVQEVRSVHPEAKVWCGIQGRVTEVRDEGTVMVHFPHLGYSPPDGDDWALRGAFDVAPMMTQDNLLEHLEAIAKFSASLGPDGADLRGHLRTLRGAFTHEGLLPGASGETSHLDNLLDEVRISKGLML